ncbi:MAG TPA: CBS domain-containing protein [Candidatus Dormibacteraeota bacterium]
MTREVATVPPGASVREIARQIAEKRVSALPVVDIEGRVLGVVSEADLLLKEGRNEMAAHARFFASRETRLLGEKAEGLVAADLMTSPALTVAPEAPLADAARLMRERGVKRLVAVDERGKLVGIISRGDVIRVFLRPDGDIRRAIVSGLAQSLLWLDVRDLEVTVEEGVVTFDGRLDRRSDVELLARLTRDIDGVVGVINHLEFAWDDRRTRRAPALSPDLATTPWS